MIVKGKIKKEELRSPFVKAVADAKKELLAFDCDLHIDCADELIRNGSKANDLWGINICPDGHIDFISLINIRPADNNRSMEIQNLEIRKRIENIVKKFL